MIWLEVMNRLYAKVKHLGVMVLQNKSVKKKSIQSIKSIRTKQTTVRMLGNSREYRKKAL